MDKDRRYYSRTTIKIESTFFIEGNEPPLRDFTGVIEDISEGGMRFVVDREHYKESVDTIAYGSIISFQAYDEYELYHQLIQEVFSGEVKVLRIDRNADGIHFGCKITNLNDKLEKYISNKKILEYIKNGYQI